MSMEFKNPSEKEKQGSTYYSFTLIWMQYFNEQYTNLYT